MRSALLTLLLVLSACGPADRTDAAPPPETERADEVPPGNAQLPDSLRGIDRPPGTMMPRPEESEDTLR